MVRSVILFLGGCALGYPHVALIVDCSFQPSNKMGVSFEERKLFFSGKHHQYGIKREYAHMPNGIFFAKKSLGVAVHVSKPHPGAHHDFVIFQESVSFYRTFLEKELGDEHLPDPEPLQANWALLADKGYIGANEFVRALIPRKALPGRSLGEADNLSNRRLSSARVICENYYGRLKGLFRICSEKFRGKYPLNITF
jgi:DDE superfamily endonuclease